MMTAKKPVNHTGSKPYKGLYGAVRHPGKKIYRLTYPNTLLTVDESDLRHDKLNGHIPQRLHPTQKPVALLNWIVRTYSNSGDTVLDPVSGSGTTAVAAVIASRNVTCIEKDPTYFEASVERVRKAVKDGGIDAEIEVRK